MRPDLRLVPALEFLPSLRIMPEPLSQLAAGRDVLHPFIDRGVALLDPARPQSVDQDSSAVIGSGWFIGPFKVDVMRCDLAHRRPWRCLCRESSSLHHRYGET